MGFDSTQKETLEIAWKRGYFSNTQHYDLLSRITGLTRKQISNWATRQTRMLGSAPLPSVEREPMANTGSIKDSKTFLDIAWDRGLLPGNENYALIQDFTNLSRKQISNWSARKMKITQGDGSSANQKFQAVAKTPRPSRKRKIKVEYHREVKKRVGRSRPAPVLTKAVNWLLMNAVNGVAIINEEKVALLSTLTGYPKAEVRKFVIANGRTVEEDVPKFAEPQPFMENKRLVPQQQQNMTLQTKALTKQDKPRIKKEEMERSKENVLSPASAAALVKKLMEQNTGP